MLFLPPLLYQAWHDHLSIDCMELDRQILLNDIRRQSDTECEQAWKDSGFSVLHNMACRHLDLSQEHMLHTAYATTKGSKPSSQGS